TALVGRSVDSAIQVMLCLEGAAKTRDYPIRSRLAFTRQHYLDSTTRGRYQTGEGSPQAPVPVLCAPDRERGVPRVPAAPRHVWALSLAGALAPGARPPTGHAPFLRGVWRRAVPPSHCGPYPASLCSSERGDEMGSHRVEKEFGSCLFLGDEYRLLVRLALRSFILLGLSSTPPIAPWPL